MSISTAFAELKNEVSAKADYFQNTSYEFSVRCQVVEGQTNLIDLTLTVPSEREAQTIVNNWRQKSGEVYAFIMKNLL